jgi:hypothetical protein
MLKIQLLRLPQGLGRILYDFRQVFFQVSLDRRTIEIKLVGDLALRFLAGDEQPVDLPATC